ncbi:MAG TPA: hypothetical protein VKE51_40460 [Vicinamibacterales bacterium]|nr:hypothetical protein [Vicinamibacterales bacterium]
MAMDLCREHLKAEHLIRRTLDLQADYIVGLWGLAIHLTATGWAAEAIPVAERLVSLSRAPIFVGTLGMAYGRAGRTDDLVRLELGERRSRGEYIAPASKVQFAIGRGDGALIRRALEDCLADHTSIYSLRAFTGLLLDDWRADGAIDELLQRLGDIRPPATSTMRI